MDNQQNILYIRSHQSIRVGGILFSYTERECDNSHYIPLVCEIASLNSSFLIPNYYCDATQKIAKETHEWGDFDTNVAEYVWIEDIFRHTFATHKHKANDDNDYSYCEEYIIDSFHFEVKVKVLIVSFAFPLSIGEYLVHSGCHILVLIVVIVEGQNTT